MARNFYVNLYKADTTPPVITSPSFIPSLSHADKCLFDRPISLAEVRKALYDISPNKALGTDGLLPAFLQELRPEVKSSI